MIYSKINVIQKSMSVLYLNLNYERVWLFWFFNPNIVKLCIQTKTKEIYHHCITSEHIYRTLTQN